jgi:tetratricopeptide (TPR) repeat protein
MAPEQAAGERHVDASADVYALAVVGYEMLAGAPPFAGPTAQAVIAAHVTATPRPITDLRPDTPQAVAQAIARALVKDPQARLRTAAEFRDAIGPAAAGVTGRARHPVRVTALYLVASLAVLGVAYLLMIALGLPSWVVPSAGILLLVGLPIIVATGVVERGRAAPQPDAAARGPLAGWLTWRRSLAGGALAFAFLGLTTAGYMTMRALGIGPVGTLVASGVLKDRDPIILADFVNRTPDSTLGPTLTEALQVDLSQSRTVRVADARSLAHALERMQQPADTRLTPDLARQLAQREGIKAIVTADVSPVDKGYALSASVIAAGDGQVLTAVRAAAADGAHLIAALDHLSKQLRERIGESLRSIRAAEPLERVTTARLEALEKYSRAVRAFDAGENERALGLLQEATALDTGFAMAHRKIAVILGNTGASTEEWVAAATRAFAHRDRLPELEREQASGYYYDVVDYDPGKAMAAYRRVLELDPDNGVARTNLGLDYMWQRQFGVAESLFARGLAVEPTSTDFLDATASQTVQGHYADAQATLDRWARTLPNDPARLEARFLFAGAQHDYAHAATAARELRAAAPASPRAQQVSADFLALTAEVQGELAQAAQWFREEMAAAETRGLPANYLRAAVTLAQIDAVYRDRSAAALEIVATALARHPLASIGPLDRPYPELAAFYAQVGRAAEARRLWNEYEALVPPGIRRGRWNDRVAEGALAAAEGRLRDALVSYQAMQHDESPCNHCGFAERAVLYERLGLPDSALAMYEQYIAAPAFRRIVLDARHLPRTYKRLGELYESRGNRAAARDYYGRFVDLWKNADPDLQPLVSDARAALKRLSAEPR